MDELIDRQAALQKMCETCGASRDHIYAENDEQAIDIWNSRNGEDIEPILKKQKWLFDKE